MTKTHTMFPHRDMNFGRNVQVKCARIPFSQNATETETKFVLPATSIVADIAIRVVTNVGGSTIEVGTLETGSTGDGDGFVAAVSCATAGFVALAGSDATTLGAFLNGADQSGSTTRIPKGFISTDERKVTYKTSAHAVTGYINLFYVDLTSSKNAK